MACASNQIHHFDIIHSILKKEDTNKYYYKNPLATRVILGYSYRTEYIKILQNNKRYRFKYGVLS
jgi:hypothetical protein